MKKNKSGMWLIGILLILYFVLRLPGFNFVYHHDEVDWATVIDPSFTTSYIIPHPPLGEFIYSTAGALVGYAHVRIVPLLFGALNVVLLYWFVRRRAGERAATWAGLFFVVSIYSVIASLMIDTDGQILPAFLLAGFIVYDYWRAAKTSSQRWWRVVILMVICLGGIMVKMSAALVPAALVLDYLWHERRRLSKKLILNIVFSAIGAALLVALLVVVSKFIFPFFNLGRSVVYWEHFINFSHRNYLQVVIETCKALMLTSPLLVLLPILHKKEDAAKITPVYFFLIVAAVFYLVLFDFSGAALDRYWQLLIVPGSIIAGVILSRLDSVYKLKLSAVMWGFVVCALAYMLQFVPHVVPSLHPKTEWFNRLIHVKWNFVFPFTGGSGPVGFYMSFLFIAVAWIAIVAGLVVIKTRPRLLTMVLPTVIMLGLVYNLAFVEEYSLGAINGSAQQVLQSTLSYIKTHPEVQHVITYNDVGAYELMNIDKYERRLYADPQFMPTYEPIFKTFRGHYMMVDMPHLDPHNFFGQGIYKCPAVFETQSGVISGSVRDCSRVRQN